jgi:DNA-binding SARP family transcriptional activator
LAATPGDVMRFSVLGPLQVIDADEHEPVAVPAARLRVLLAVLLWRANRPTPVDELAEMVWDGAPPPGTAVAARALVMRLRRTLGERAAARIVTRAPGYLIELSEDELDVCVFEALSRDAGALARSGRWAQAGHQAAMALGLWRGTPLADVSSRLLRDQWVPHLEEARVQTLEWRIEADQHQGRHEQLIGELRELTRQHPLRERFHAQLMLALDRAGRQAEALAAYREARSTLVAQLGVEPGPELRQTHQWILAGDTALVTPPPAAKKSQSPPSDAAIPSQLPATVRSFIGRQAELDMLCRLAASGGEAPPVGGTVVISAIDGMAGVGKTTLALSWAHRVADLFPDGQLYVNLRGFDPSGVPVAPTQAVRGFLDALGVPPQRIPPGADAQAGLYRGLVADKQMLIVLDNARDEEQVRPLLPASPASLVLVTSRSQLVGLAATDGARLLSLDVLTHDEAVQLLTARLGNNRAAAEPGALSEMAALCGRLPLALAVAAARASARPHFPLAALATELRGAAGRLDVLDSADPAASVRAVFSWSYRQLSPDAARLFLLLGLHTGPDISVLATASLAAVDEPRARRLLDELARGCLITERAPGRYSFHDLLRVYAAEQAHALESDDELRTATHRMLDYYLHSAHRAAMLVDPLRDPLPLPAPAPGVSLDLLADHGEALTWCEAQFPVLLAVSAFAAASGFDRHAWQIPWAITGFLNRRAYWNEWHSAECAALAAAVRVGDRYGHAHVQHGLGDVMLFLGRPEEAKSHYSAALDLYGELGDQAGQARACQLLAVALQWQGRHHESLACAGRAIKLFRAIGHRAGEGEATTIASQDLALLGSHAQATRLCVWAIRRHHELGNRTWKALALTSLGYIRHADSRHAAAIGCFTRALGILRENGVPRQECFTLTLLAEAQQAAGDPGAAQTRKQALAIVDDLFDPDANMIRARLRDPSTPIPRLC